MDHFLSRIFLTFVLILFPVSLLASPDPGKVKTDSASEKLSEVSDPVLLMASQEKILPQRHRIRSTLTWMAGEFAQNDESTNQTAVGLSYSYDFDELKSYEYQFHWLTGKAAWFQWSERQLLNFDALFEPYYKYGVSFFADPDDGTASLTRIDNYKGTLAVGVLDLTDFGKWLTFEMGLHLGSSGLAFHVQAGLQILF
jgi:hypothetical protein